MLGTYHSDALLNALSDLHHIHDRNFLYSFFLNRCCDVLKAQGGTFFTVREHEGALYPEVSKGVAISLLQEIPFKMKMGLSGWVATTQRSVMVDNAATDPRFNRAVDVITGIKTKSLICVPVVRQGKILGVLELVNKLEGIFREGDLKFAEYLSSQVAVAIENCLLYEDLNSLLVYTNSVINSLTGGFISTDKFGVVTRCNASACRILGINTDDVVKRPLLESLSQYPAFAAILDVTQKHETPVQRQEIELQRPDGTALFIGYSTFLIRDDAHTTHGAGIIFQDLTRFKKT